MHPFALEPCCLVPLRRVVKVRTFVHADACQHNVISTKALKGIFYSVQAAASRPTANAPQAVEYLVHAPIIGMAHHVGGLDRREVSGVQTAMNVDRPELNSRTVDAYHGVEVGAVDHRQFVADCGAGADD